MREKNFWILLVFLLCGVVIGGLIAYFGAQVSWLSWLSYGEEFGTNGPLGIDLSVLKFSIEIRIKINVAVIIGMLIAVIAYRKI